MLSFLSKNYSDTPVTLIIKLFSVCCQAQIAECLACKAGMNVTEYCKISPQTIGCPKGK